ncbi:hypothetical protein [Endozoicomonas sp. 8E]|nr:hypothetical protein [Endozoicomonas sp. 8E]WOG29121.1 hypothetical protein P6910_05505 [Endozoicomonas sp. 8E]
MPSIENKRDLPPSLQSLNKTPDKKKRKKEHPPRGELQGLKAW